MTTKTIDRAAEIAALGLTVDAVFVPFSRSRNKDEKLKTLNWRVTVKRNGREVLTTDYSAGVAHCPAYKASAPDFGFTPHRYRNSEGKTRAATAREALEQFREAASAAECEEGFAVRFNAYRNQNDWARKAGAKPIMPDPLDVIYSLTMDSDVLNYSTFEDWAETFGYDPDSRKGETTYRACLELALKMRAALGEAGLERLNVIFQDY